MLALRPEGTAGTVRAFVEHGCHVEGPQKWYYVGAMFRRERPQKGRYRLFHQIGCEAFGSPSRRGRGADSAARRLPGPDGRPGRAPAHSVGDASCRPAYLADLRAWLSSRRDDLCPDCNDRIERNPLRVLDCKVESCQPVLDRAPRLLERLCPSCAAHFESVKGALDALGGLPLDTRLVRGLDYYVRTAYEFTSSALARSRRWRVGGGTTRWSRPWAPAHPGHRVRARPGAAGADPGIRRAPGAGAAAGDLLRDRRRGSVREALRRARSCARRHRLRHRPARWKDEGAVPAGGAGGSPPRDRPGRNEVASVGRSSGHGHPRGDESTSPGSWAAPGMRSGTPRGAGAPGRASRESPGFPSGRRLLQQSDHACDRSRPGPRRRIRPPPRISPRGGEACRRPTSP